MNLGHNAPYVFGQTVRFKCVIINIFIYMWLVSNDSISVKYPKDGPSRTSESSEVPSAKSAQSVLGHYYLSHGQRSRRYKVSDSHRARRRSPVSGDFGGKRWAAMSPSPNTRALPGNRNGGDGLNADGNGEAAAPKEQTANGTIGR